MQHYSGGYLPNNLNFEITDIPLKEDIDKNIYGVLCVLKNILFRGAPTIPSKYLQSEITDNLRYLYTFRIQVVLLDLMMKGYIDFTGKVYNFNINEYNDTNIADAKIAAQDLLIWLKNLFDIARTIFSIVP